MLAPVKTHGVITGVWVILIACALIVFPIKITTKLAFDFLALVAVIKVKFLFVNLEFRFYIEEQNNNYFIVLERKNSKKYIEFSKNNSKKIDIAKVAKSLCLSVETLGFYSKIGKKDNALFSALVSSFVKIPLDIFGGFISTFFDCKFDNLHTQSYGSDELKFGTLCIIRASLTDIIISGISYLIRGRRVDNRA
ncbi:MAG: hypothetical protein IJY70_04960 [Clostridia bacterium]|nr:hypothetical protein [Clostridia bacterium]